MGAKGKFKYGDRDIPMHLTYRFVLGKLDDMGIDILNLASDSGESINNLLINDRLMLKIWYHFVNEETGDDWDTAVNVLDETDGGLNDFREKFFDLIVAFSAPQMREILREIWKEAKKQLKDSQKVRSMLTSSSSQEEQE